MKNIYLFCFLTFSIFTHSQNITQKIDFWKHHKVDIKSTKNFKTNAVLNYHLPIQNFDKFRRDHYFENEFTLFLVVKSKSGIDSKKLYQVFNLEESNKIIEVTTQDISFKSRSSVSEVKDSDFGTIIKIQYKDPKQKKGLLHFANFDSLEGEVNIYEVIFSSKGLYDIEQRQLETYLSIKYGIKIKNDYLSLNASDTLLHKSKEMGEFNNNLLGLGKDKNFNLNQKQSQFNKSKFISVGLDNIKDLNDENKSHLHDNFLFIGDNGKTLDFIWDDENKSSVLSKRWKILLIGENFKTLRNQDLIVVLSANALIENEIITKTNFKELKLSINKGHNDIDRKIIQSDSIDNYNRIYFSINLDALSLKDNQIYFTFEKVKDFNLEYNLVPACLNDKDLHKAEISILKGNAPYTVKIINNNNENVFQDIFKEKNFIINYKSDTNYFLKITDARGLEYEEEIKYVFPKMREELKKSVETALNSNNSFLDLNSTIKPEIFDYFELLFYQDKDLIKTNTLNLDNVETLTIKAKNNYSCECILDYQIHSNTPARLDIFPNPANISTPFTIRLNRFDVPREKELKVKIYSISGKHIKTYVLSNSNGYKTKALINSSGIYNVFAQDQKKRYVGKIIIE